MMPRRLLFALTVCLLGVAPFPVATAEAEAEAHYAGRAVSSWQADLTSPLPQARYDALVALTEIGPDAETAVDDIARLLDDTHPQVGSQAALALAALGERGADALIATLASEHARLRALAADALTYADPPRGRAVDALLPLLDDQIETVRFLSAFALAAVAPERPESLRVLREALTGTSAPAQLGALEAVGRLGPRAVELLPAVRPFLDAPDERYLTAAGRALRAMGPSLLAVLLRDLREPVGRRSVDGVIVTIGVVAELGRSDARVARTLLEVARSPRPGVAHAALRVLPQVGVGDPEAAARLSALVLEAPSGANTSITALETLAALGLEPSEAATETVLVRIAATLTPEDYGRTLAAFGERQRMRLLRFVRELAAPNARARAIRALAAGCRESPSWRESSLDFLVNRLSDPAPEPRAAAADATLSLAIGDIRAADRAAELVEFLEDGARAVVARVFVELVARSLAAEGAASAADPAWAGLLERRRPLLQSIARGEDARASAWARLALGSSATPAEVRRDLLPLLGSEAIEVRLAACDLLGRRRGGADALAKVILDPNEHPAVRRAAASAYGQAPGVAANILEHIRRGDPGDRVLWWIAAVELSGEDATALHPVIDGALGDPELAIRAAAGLVLSKSSEVSESHIAALAGLLESSDASVRRTALGTAVELGARARALGPALFDRMTRADEGERVAYAETLAGIEWHDVAAALAHRSKWHVALCALAVVVAVHSPPRALGELVEHTLRHPDSMVRAFAAAILPGLDLDGAPAAAWLVPVLADPVGRVRAEAAASLGSLGPKALSAREALERVAAEDPFPFVREAARTALRAIPK